jgi:hypothetical protein
MDVDELVSKVVLDITRQGGFPNPVPSVMSVIGGNASVRSAVVSALNEKYKHGEILDGGNEDGSSVRGYRIVLSGFIGKYDKFFC